MDILYPIILYFIYVAMGQNPHTPVNTQPAFQKDQSGRVVGARLADRGDSAFLLRSMLEPSGLWREAARGRREKDLDPEKMTACFICQSAL